MLHRTYTYARMCTHAMNEETHHRSRILCSSSSSRCSSMHAPPHKYTHAHILCTKYLVPRTSYCVVTALSHIHSPQSTVHSTSPQFTAGKQSHYTPENKSTHHWRACTWAAHDRPSIHPPTHHHSLTHARHSTYVLVRGNYYVLVHG